MSRTLLSEFADLLQCASWARNYFRHGFGTALFDLIIVLLRLMDYYSFSQCLFFGFKNSGDGPEA
jgi:hypothetical protein